MGADRQGRRIEGGCRKIIQERAAPAVSKFSGEFCRLASFCRRIYNLGIAEERCDYRTGGTGGWSQAQQG